MSTDAMSEYKSLNKKINQYFFSILHAIFKKIMIYTYELDILTI